MSSGVDEDMFHTNKLSTGQGFYGLLCGWAQEFHRVFLCEQTGFMKISLLRAEHIEGDGGLGGRAGFTSEGGDMTERQEVGRIVGVVKQGVGIICWQ